MKTENENFTLETYEWDQTWIENAEDMLNPRILYIGDSISIPTRVKLNGYFGGNIRVDGFASSKAADHPFFAESVRLFTAQQKAPYRAVLFNNGLHGWHLDDVQAYPLRYESLVARIKKLFPQAKLIILTTTPLKDAEMDLRVQKRNNAALKTAEKYKTGIIDMYNASPELKSYLSEDGVHFTDEGYRILADTVASGIKLFFEMKTGKEIE